ncbi:islet amyloid polypeptide [Numenius arquata]|uniref:islet amyloid polypeptide n=1 Tax=Numenius arquata TaxID=31919 RepID=UPI003D30B5FF
MCHLKLSVFFIALSVTLSCLEATPIENHHLEKRKCNTATCVTQRLADFLVRSSGNIGAIYSHTNVGSNTYGKRDTVGFSRREPQNNAQV